MYCIQMSYKMSTCCYTLHRQILEYNTLQHTHKLLNGKTDNWMDKEYKHHSVTNIHHSNYYIHYCHMMNSNKDNSNHLMGNKEQCSCSNCLNLCMMYIGCCNYNIEHCLGKSLLRRLYIGCNLCRLNSYLSICSM